MAIDSRQKRMAAINVSQPWRGPMVDPSQTGFNAGNRAAAAFYYSGIAFSGGGGGPPGSADWWIIRVRRRRRSR